jgi:superfamily II DNA or RNA helicase
MAREGHEIEGGSVKYELRKYQEKEADAAAACLLAGGKGVLQLPTGAGKTVVTAEVLTRISSPQARSLFVVPLIELVNQTVRTIPGSIDLQGSSKIPQGSIYVACRETAVRRIAKIPSLKYVVFDECHIGVAQQKRILSQAPEGTSYIGLSATPENHEEVKYAVQTVKQPNGKKDKQVKKLDDVGNPIVLKDETVSSLYPGGLISQMLTRELIDGGWLNKIDYRISSSFREEKLVLKNGQYTEGSVSKELMLSQSFNTAIDWLRLTTEEFGPRHAIIVCSSVHDAETAGQFARDGGFTCETVSGGTSLAERDRIYADFREGRLDCISSCMLLTYGFDAPIADACICLRPTESRALYLQMIGRVIRIHNDKPTTIFFDIVGNCNRFHIDKADLELLSREDLQLTLDLTQGDGENLYPVEIGKRKKKMTVGLSLDNFLIPTSYFYVKWALRGSESLEEEKDEDDQDDDDEEEDEEDEREPKGKRKRSDKRLVHECYFNAGRVCANAFCKYDERTIVSAAMKQFRAVKTSKGLLPQIPNLDCSLYAKVFIREVERAQAIKEEEEARAQAAEDAKWLSLSTEILTKTKRMIETAKEVEFAAGHFTGYIKIDLMQEAHSLRTRAKQVLDYADQLYSKVDALPVGEGDADWYKEEADKIVERVKAENLRNHPSLYLADTQARAPAMDFQSMRDSKRITCGNPSSLDSANHFEREFMSSLKATLVNRYWLSLKQLRIVSRLVKKYGDGLTINGLRLADLLLDSFDMGTETIRGASGNQRDITNEDGGQGILDEIFENMELAGLDTAADIGSVG